MLILWFIIHRSPFVVYLLLLSRLLLDADRLALAAAPRARVRAGALPAHGHALAMAQAAVAADIPQARDVLLHLTPQTISDVNDYYGVTLLY